MKKNILFVIVILSCLMMLTVLNSCRHEPEAESKPVQVYRHNITQGLTSTRFGTYYAEHNDVRYVINLYGCLVDPYWNGEKFTGLDYRELTLYVYTRDFLTGGWMLPEIYTGTIEQTFYNRIISESETLKEDVRTGCCKVDFDKHYSFEHKPEFETRDDRPCYVLYEGGAFSQGADIYDGVFDIEYKSGITEIDSVKPSYTGDNYEAGYTYSGAEVLSFTVSLNSDEAASLLIGVGDWHKDDDYKTVTSKWKTDAKEYAYNSVVKGNYTYNDSSDFGVPSGSAYPWMRF